MNKQTISTEPYLEFADRLCIDRHEFLTRYLPHLITSAMPGLLFTTIGDTEIELQDGFKFPEVDDISKYVEQVKTMLLLDNGVFERTYESGEQVRETYQFPPVRSEAEDLVALIPDGFDMTNAFSIGLRPASGPYPDDYITVYFRSDYQNHGAVCYGAKFGCATGELLDVKLLFTDVPSVFQQHVPAAACSVLFGMFIKDTKHVDVYFAFNTESDFAAYFGEGYTAPPKSTLGLGMVGVTVDADTNSVIRVKRYVF